MSVMRKTYVHKPAVYAKMSMAMDTDNCSENSEKKTTGVSPRREDNTGRH